MPPSSSSTAICAHWLIARDDKTRRANSATITATLVRKIISGPPTAACQPISETAVALSDQPAGYWRAKLEPICADVAVALSVVDERRRLELDRRFDSSRCPIHGSARNVEPMNCQVPLLGPTRHQGVWPHQRPPHLVQVRTGYPPEPPAGRASQNQRRRRCWRRQRFVALQCLVDLGNGAASGSMPICCKIARSIFVS